MKIAAFLHKFNATRKATPNRQPFDMKFDFIFSALERRAL